jgi:hypothetical protein
VLKVGGQVAEDRHGDLAVGGAAALEPAVDDVRFGGRMIPGDEIAEWRCVQARIEAVRWAGRRSRDLVAELQRDELADILIYLLRLADVVDVDLVAAAHEKASLNTSRSWPDTDS